MQAIFNVVLPVFAIIAAGFACGHYRLLGPDSSEALNRFVYWVALPVLLFRAMATVDIGVVFEPGFLSAYVLGQMLVWLLALFLARTLYGRGLAEGAMHGMSGVYGNTGYMGIPLALAAYGEPAAVPTILVTVINAVLIVAVAAILIEIGQSRGGGLRRLGADIGLSLARNPMLISALLGMVWAATGAPLPGPLDGFTRILGAAAGPCALFAIGLFLVGRPLREGLSEVGCMTVLKLLVQPAVTAVLVLYVFDVDPLWAVIAILMAATPTGAGSFVLAQAYGLYVQRTSSVILISTVLSIFTLSAIFLIYPPSQ
ncbi:MAG: AEC family transporter [Pseudomonadota bacterium]|nr:AEC family transporter [Pseudomonadota bacterium]